MLVLCLASEYRAQYTIKIENCACTLDSEKYYSLKNFDFSLSVEANVDAAPKKLHFFQILVSFGVVIGSHIFPSVAPLGHSGSKSVRFTSPKR